MIYELGEIITEYILFILKYILLKILLFIQLVDIVKQEKLP